MIMVPLGSGVAGREVSELNAPLLLCSDPGMGHSHVRDTRGSFSTLEYNTSWGIPVLRGVKAPPDRCAHVCVCRAPVCRLDWLQEAKGLVLVLLFYSSAV